MIQPPYLKPGATIGITCPSGHLDVAKVPHCCDILSSWGYQTIIGKTVGSGPNYFSGTDDERLADLQAMMDNPNISAILMGRGGYGMSRIIDRLDFTAFLRHPKWICGFSDITVFHNHLQAQFGMQSLHSPMCGHFRPDTAAQPYLLSLKTLLAGQPMSYTLPPSPGNRIGAATGILTGGNLALIAHLTGSASEVDTTGKILFLEDVGEYLYSIDRMMLHLDRAGKLAPLAGIVFGGFTDLKDTERPYGSGITDILTHRVAKYHYPVALHLPTGHQDINYSLALGATHTLMVTPEGGTLVLDK